MDPRIAASRALLRGGPAGHHMQRRVNNGAHSGSSSHIPAVPCGEAAGDALLGESSVRMQLCIVVFFHLHTCEGCLVGRMRRGCCEIHSCL